MHEWRDVAVLLLMRRVLTRRCLSIDGITAWYCMEIFPEEPGQGNIRVESRGREIEDNCTAFHTLTYQVLENVQYVLILV